MSLKRVIKKLGTLGATTLVAALKIGGGEVGDVAADFIAKAVGLDKKDPKFTQKLDRMLTTQDGKRLILEAEHRFKTQQHELFNEDTIAKIQAEVAMFEQAQLSYRAELLTKDPYISHTRPWLVRTSVKMGIFIVASLFLSTVADMVYVTVMTGECETPECFEFLRTRPTFNGWLAAAYATQMVWLGAQFTGVVAFVGGRTYEKKNGVAV